MHDMVIAIAKWLEGTSWGLMARESPWAYPFVQLIHFTGLSIWLGTTFALDLRLLGVGHRRSTPAQLAQGLFVWNWLGFAIVLAGGFMLFSGLATAFVDNPAFQWKLAMFVPLALVWHVVLQNRARTWKSPEAPAIAKLAATGEILIWICVVAAAVQIPNY